MIAIMESVAPPAAHLLAGSRLLVHALSDTLGSGSWRVLFAVGNFHLSHLAPCLLEIGLTERTLSSRSAHDPLEVLALALGTHGLITAESTAEHSDRMVWSIEDGRVQALSAMAAARFFTYEVALGDAPRIAWALI